MDLCSPRRSPNSFDTQYPARWRLYLDFQCFLSLCFKISSFIPLAMVLEQNSPFLYLCLHPASLSHWKGHPHLFPCPSHGGWNSGPCAAPAHSAFFLHLLPSCLCYVFNTLTVLNCGIHFVLARVALYSNFNLYENRTRVSYFGFSIPPFPHAQHYA